MSSYEALAGTYDALTGEQRTLVTNYAKLEAAVKAVSAPKTGDTTPVALLGTMMILSMLAAAALVIKTKKQKI